VHLFISESLVLGKFVVKADFDLVEDILFVDQHRKLKGLALLKIDKLVLPLHVLSDYTLATVRISLVVNSERIFVLRVFTFLCTMLYHTHSEAGISSEELARVGFVGFHHNASSKR
jgi:hypothetical protein